jgi:hypothetical protein
MGTGSPSAEISTTRRGALTNIPDAHINRRRKLSTLATTNPARTAGLLLPHAPTLFDCIRRATRQNAPRQKSARVVGYSGKSKRSLEFLGFDGARLAEIHQFPDRTIVEMLHTHVPLELLDRDFAREAVIGAVKAD